MRRIRIINSTKIKPDCKTNYVVDFADSLQNNKDSKHSVWNYVQTCIDSKRETLVFMRKP